MTTLKHSYLEELEKARYIKRTGEKGRYKYQYHAGKNKTPGKENEDKQGKGGSVDIHFDKIGSAFKDAPLAELTAKIQKIIPTIKDASHKKNVMAVLQKFKAMQASGQQTFSGKTQTPNTENGKMNVGPSSHKEAMDFHAKPKQEPKMQKSLSEIFEDKISGKKEQPKEMKKSLSGIFSEELIKAKYIKREGTPGAYKYTYKELAGHHNTISQHLEEKYREFGDDESKWKPEQKEYYDKKISLQSKIKKLMDSHKESKKTPLTGKGTDTHPGTHKKGSIGAYVEKYHSRKETLSKLSEDKISDIYQKTSRYLKIMDATEGTHVGPAGEKFLKDTKELNAMAKKLMEPVWERSKKKLSGIRDQRMTDDKKAIKPNKKKMDGAERRDKEEKNKETHEEKRERISAQYGKEADDAEEQFKQDNAEARLLEIFRKKPEDNSKMKKSFSDIFSEVLSKSGENEHTAKPDNEIKSLVDSVREPGKSRSIIGLMKELIGG